MRSGTASPERARAGRIDVRARRHGGRLVLEVEDDGSGLPQGAGREGVGVGNTKARLAEMYGRDQDFELVGSKTGTVARVSIPWQTDHNPAGGV